MPTPNRPRGPKAALASTVVPLAGAVLIAIAVPMAFAVGPESPAATASVEPTGAPLPVDSPAASAATATPTPSPTPSLSPTPAASSTGVATPQPAATPSAATAASAGLVGAGTVLARLPEDGLAASYLTPGERLTDALAFDSFRIDVLAANAGAEALTWTPRLEYRVAGLGDFVAVPTGPEPGSPLHLTEEWVAVPGGTKTGPATDTLAAASAHLSAPAAFVLSAGRRSSGPNPDRGRTLDAGTAAEHEFTVGLSIDAAFSTTYELRVTDDGTPIPGLETALVTTAVAPAVVQPDQPSAGTNGGGAAIAPAGAAAMYRLTTANQALGAPVQYELLAAAPPVSGIVGPNGPATIHQPFTSTTSTQCATCHSTHRGESAALLTASSQTAECYTCHSAGGLGGGLDTQSQFGSVAANDEATRSYYSHDLTTPGHTLASDDAFAGQLNRHSQCSDCHNPHNLSADPDAYNAATATWTVSGSYGAVPGVAVTNGAAGTAPTYTPLDGVLNPVTSEYQLCFKCHSGFTTQLANDPARPSRDRTDLGVAFNPANASFHPIEAPGKNQSTKMADSLVGWSSYRIWSLTPGDTVRCVMCHTSGTAAARAASNANLTVHASANRGILIRPYENRVLSARGAFYDAAGAALCLTCHAETPFMNSSGSGAATATNFDFHGLHMAGMRSKGSGGLDIDTAGAGQGNARCAECHFRTHSSTQGRTDQSITGQGLVSFAPAVLGLKSAVPSAPPKFVKTATGGTCTLTCHGKNHEGAKYQK